jgi:predicted ester cyclase
MDEHDPTDPRHVVERFHLRLWADGDEGAIDEMVDPAAVTSMTGWSGTTVDALRDDVRRYRGAFDDVATEIRELLADGDRVVLWWTTAGTHVGPYGDIAPIPTGRRIVMEGIDVLTVREGRIVAVRSFWDAAEVYRQFGLLPQGL